jgi:capsular polysaccharide biosynthesis protein
MEIKRFILFAVKKAWIVLLLAMIGTGAAGLFVQISDKTAYSAETSLYVLSKKDTALTISDVELGRQIIGDLKSILYSRKVLSPVIQELKDYDLSYDDLLKAITAEYQTDSNILVISIKWPDQSRVSSIANGVSKSFTNQINLLTDSDTVNLIDEAETPEEPVPSKMLKFVLIGFLAGALLAFGIIYVMELNDTTIRSSEDLEENLGLKVLAVIPKHSMK